MQTKIDTPEHQPILEPWRIAALLLIIAAAMLFVRAIEPSEGNAAEWPSRLARADR